MVLAEQLALHLEQVLRVPQVTHQVTADLRQGLDRVRVDLHPGLQHRVVGDELLTLTTALPPGIQGHRAVVGVHHRLDRVADVVDVLR